MAKAEKEISIWISYEDTLENQNKFLAWIEIMEKTKGTVPPQQRARFFKQLSKATLTVGRGQKAVYKTKKGKRLPMGNVHYFAQRLAYQTNQITKWKFGTDTYEIPISELWRLLKDYLLQIFPYAQNEALRMSAERFRNQSKPGSVEYFPSSRAYKDR